MKVYVFDLDDTLYDEMDFVRSGFQAVAIFLSQHGVNEKAAYNLMLEVLEQQGRGAVFDRVLAHYKLLSYKMLRHCLSVYRLHTPNIRLSEEAEIVLDRLEGEPIYIVTDGNKRVQRNKIRALGLDKRITKAYVTYQYGRKYSKPSPYCFQKIAESENVDYKDMVYVGDNPNKDFIGIKPLGIRTIQVRKGAFYHLSFDELHRAETEVSHLPEIFDVIAQWEEASE